MSGVLAVLLLATSVAWTDGETPAKIADDAISLTYEGTKVKTMTLSTEDTVVIAGGTMNFAADATISSSAAGKIVLSNDVVTAGKLTVGINGELEYANGEGGYLNNSTYTVMFSNARLSDYAVKCTNFRNGGGNSNNLISGSGYPYFETRADDDHLVVQLQTWDWMYTRCVVIELIQQGDDIAGKIVNVCWGEPRAYFVGRDLINDPHATQDPDFVFMAPDYKPGYGLNHLILSNRVAAVADVSFAGKLTLGGELSVADLGKVTTIGAETLASPLGTFSGNLAVDGLMTVLNHESLTVNGAFSGDGTIEFAADDTQSLTTYNEEFFQADWKVVATNRQLSALTGLTARMGGEWFGNTLASREPGYFLTFNADKTEASVQFQHGGADKQIESVRCAVMNLRQNGQNIEGKIVSACYYEAPKSGWGTSAEVRQGSVDVLNPGSTTLKTAYIATRVDSGSYGAGETIFTYSSVERKVTVKDTNTMSTWAHLAFRGDDGAQLLADVAVRDAMPKTGFLDIHTNAEVSLSVGGQFGVGVFSSEGSTLKHRIFKGGRLRSRSYYQFAWESIIMALGGEFSHECGDNGSPQYINRMLVADGGSLTGYHTRCGWATSSTYLAVAGTEPCHVSLPIGVLDYLGNNDANFYVSVADARDDGEPTLVLDGKVGLHNTNNRVTVEKYGRGCVRQNVATDFVKPLSVNSGTWMLGANAVTTQDVVLAGGSLAVAAGTSNSPGALSVTQNSGLAIGSGAKLAFPSLSIAEKATLTVADPYEDETLRIGTSHCLPRSVRSAISLGGKKAYQNSDGWLVTSMGMVLFLR